MTIQKNSNALQIMSNALCYDEIADEWESVEDEEDEENEES